MVTNSLQETRAFGASIAREARVGDVYGLVGELGTGKTEFVRGFVAALNPDAVVRSPSFTLVNIYESPAFPIYHFDFYRLKNASELLEIGFHEYICGDGVCIIEWADMFREEVPEPSRFIRFTDLGDGKREIAFDSPRPPFDKLRDRPTLSRERG
jgi:tRNA threonylcarbamoyladenosine biosynthesis protein TsaE